MFVRNGGEVSYEVTSDLFRVLFDSVIDEAMAVLDPGGRVIGWNLALARMTGCPADRAMGRHASRFWPGWVGLPASLPGRRQVRARWMFEDGPTFDAVVTVATFPENAGQPTGSALIVRPGVSDEARLEADRDRVMRSVSLPMARMPLACCVYDTEARIIAWNPAAERMFGFSESEAIGHRPYDLIIPESAHRQVEDVERRLWGGDMSAHSVNENLTKDGRTILCQWTNTPLQDADGRMLGLLSMAEDVTERERAEAALRANEHLFRSIFEGALDALLIADNEGCYLEANSAAGEVFGVDPVDLIGRSISEFLGPELDFGLGWSTFLEVGRSRGSLRLIRPDGTTREVEYNSVANVLPGRHLSVIRDVTEWKREEKARQESERLTRSVLDSLSARIAVLDEDGRILQVNPAWSDFAKENGVPGLAVSEGANYLKVCDSVVGKGAEDAAAFASGIRDVLVGTRPHFIREYSLDVGRQLVHFKGRVDPVEGEGPPRVVVSHLDVTDRKTTEDALKLYAGRLERLRSIEREILAPRSPEEIARTILDSLTGLIPYCSATVEIFDSRSGEDRILATTREAGLIDRPSEFGAGYLVRIPLVHDGETIGSIDIGSDSPPLQIADHLELVREVADSLAIGIRQALLYEEIASGKERLKQVSRRLIRAEEDERRRIARELHDEIGQAMTAAKIHIQAASRMLDDPSRAGPRLEEGISLVERTLRQIRSISLDLRPSLLDDFGLVAALRSLLNTQARLGGFATHLNVVADDPEFRLGPELETACFRVAQENLTNIVRHAGARNVEVHLRRGDRDLELIVSDDGVGFDSEAMLDRASSGESFGLLGIRERVALLGGLVGFASEPGGGSRVLARFPLDFDQSLAVESPP